MTLSEPSCFFSALPPRQAKTLETSLHLFTTRGFFKTSVHDISNLAEVSVGFIYHHFKDKEGIAQALYNILLQRMNELIDDIEAQYSTCKERCYAIIQALFKLTEQEPEAMQFIIHARHKEFLPNEKSICSASAFVRMRALVFQGIENKEIRPMDPLVAAMIVYGGAIRMICLRLDGVIETSLETLADDLWLNTWSGLDP
ncbi:transcriptional regulator, TetR family [Oceanospirillum multiglobuliferum]|uniref:TetR family transcriptional regulator n=1 Tax=Oceanospirillum multiglobuliferum TaxID=64969 RepID=A0A1T4M418_9GAMM|nr:TetR/AcrR family transcriptional regulator [Oceanospirillum multiglobuliferum]OPX56252.1 TetR family transcriptional regulator [Oceanospirillum multiglobuliferum]SJZ61703.1 transcriptional regulator, TetR family [Oceanospirillum multiglobuliferum]